MAKTPRVRMFAGPNGSGKSTIKSILDERLLGVYINPDDIQKSIEYNGYIDLHRFKLELNRSKFDEYVKYSFIKLDAKSYTIDENKIFFKEINSYIASIVASYIREKLLEKKISFTFETVMSSYDKVEFLKKAKERGFRTYLYYIATVDPLINISRVKQRVKYGGHDVPKDKIESRYFRSLENLKDAIKYSDRAYIFDNSSIKRTWLAQINDNKEIDLKVDKVPLWLYKYFLKDNIG